MFKIDATKISISFGTSACKNSSERLGCEKKKQAEKEAAVRIFVCVCVIDKYQDNNDDGKKRLQ